MWCLGVFGDNEGKGLPSKLPRVLVPSYHLTSGSLILDIEANFTVSRNGARNSDSSRLARGCDDRTSPMNRPILCDYRQL